MSKPQFVTSRRVEFCDTDMAGIVHFANFYRYMEIAEHEFYSTLGMSIMKDQPDGTVIGWPRVSATCSFEAPAHYQDVLEVRVNVERLGARSLTTNYEFWRGETRIARGQMKTVRCRFAPGEPLCSLDIPPEEAAKLQPPA